MRTSPHPCCVVLLVPPQLSAVLPFYLVHPSMPCATVVLDFNMDSRHWLSSPVPTVIPYWRVWPKNFRIRQNPCEYLPSLALPHLSSSGLHGNCTFALLASAPGCVGALSPNASHIPPSFKPGKRTASKAWACFESSQNALYCPSSTLFALV